MTLDLNAIKADLDQTQDPKDAAADWLRTRGHLVAAVAEIERLTAERDGLRRALNNGPRVGACDHGVPLEDDCSECDDVGSRLARLTAEYAALGKVVKEWQEAKKAELAAWSDPTDHDSSRWLAAQRPLEVATAALAAHPLEANP